MTGSNIQRRYGFAPGTSSYNFLTRQGNPYGIGGGNAVLPPEAYPRSGTGGYPTSVLPTSNATGAPDLGNYTYNPSRLQGTGYGSGSSTDVVYDPFTGESGSYYDSSSRLPPAASYSPDTSGTSESFALDNAFPPGKGQYYRFLGGDLQGSVYGSSSESGGQNIPPNEDVMPNNPDVYFGEPNVFAPGGARQHPAAYGPTVTAYPYAEPIPDWVDNAINQNPFRVPLDANGYPIPGSGGNFTAPNWAQNAAQTRPYGQLNAAGSFAQAQNAFIPGLVSWNQGGFGANPSSGEVSDSLFSYRHGGAGALASRFGLSGRQSSGGGVAGTQVRNA